MPAKIYLMDINNWNLFLLDFFLVLYNSKSYVMLKTDDSLQININEKIAKLLGVKENQKISIELYLNDVSKKIHALP